MSLATVRTVVAGYFGGIPTVVVDAQGQNWTTYRATNVAGLSTLFLAKPSDDNQDDYFQGGQPGTRTGAKAILFMNRKSSVRTAMAGDHDGIRANSYRCVFQIYGLAVSDHTELAQTDFDAILDGMEAFLYADRSMGTINSDTGYILDAGEGTAGLTIIQQPLVYSDGKSWLYAEVGFNVREWIHG